MLFRSSRCSIIWLRAKTNAKPQEPSNHAPSSNCNLRFDPFHGSAEVTPQLLNKFLDPESCVRLAAAEVLAKRIDPALAPEFLRLLADPNFEVRLSAVLFLGRIRHPQIAEALLPLLADSDSDVRQAVAQALGTMGEPAAIEGLVLALLIRICFWAPRLYLTLRG